MSRDLYDRAVAISERAYAPYSNYLVGAAVRTSMVAVAIAEGAVLLELVVQTTYGTVSIIDAAAKLPRSSPAYDTAVHEVLRLGGYAREFFVSQTPELTAMAE